MMLTLVSKPDWNIRQNKYWTVPLSKTSTWDAAVETSNTRQQGISEHGRLGAKWMEKNLSQAKT